MTASVATTPVVSVVLPTFNRLEFLRYAIESVFAQTFASWELIVADDGSDEETRAYLRTIENLPRVKVIWLPHSGNPGAVRNAALHKAVGEYVAFLDSDDVWMPTKLERQLNALRSSPNCRWGYTGYARIDENGKSWRYPSTKQWLPYRGAIFERLLTFDAEISTPAVLVERQLLEQFGGFDEEQWVYEDYDLWLRIALHNEIDLIDEPLIQLRSHNLHYKCADLRLPSRLRLLNKMHGFVADLHLRAVIARLRLRAALNLASFYAETDRAAAARILLSGCSHSWRYVDWWAGLPRVSLKLSTPRGLLDIYRRGRFRRRTASAHS